MLVDVEGAPRLEQGQDRTSERITYTNCYAAPGSSSSFPDHSPSTLILVLELLRAQEDETGQATYGQASDIYYYIA